MKSCGCIQHKVISFSGFVAVSILHPGNFTQATSHKQLYLQEKRVQCPLNWRLCGI